MGQSCPGPPIHQSSSPLCYTTFVKMQPRHLIFVGICFLLVLTIRPAEARPQILESIGDGIGEGIGDAFEGIGDFFGSLTQRSGTNPTTTGGIPIPPPGPAVPAPTFQQGLDNIVGVRVE